MVDSFRMQAEIKMDSKAYFAFLDEHLLSWLRWKAAESISNFCLFMTIYRHMLKCITSNRIINLPPSSHYTNCIENFLVTLDGQTYHTKDTIWRAPERTDRAFPLLEIEKLTFRACFCNSKARRLYGILEMLITSS